VARFTLAGASKPERLQYRAVFIPKGARLVPGPAGSAVYVYDVIDKAGTTVYYALVFRGSAGKPDWHYRFKTDERRQQTIADFRASVASAQARRDAVQQERAAWTNPLTVGAILYTSWGYDQTNVEF
jgi:hypothetical protein